MGDWAVFSYSADVRDRLMARIALDNVPLFDLLRYICAKSDTLVVWDDAKKELRFVAAPSATAPSVPIAPRPGGE